MPIVGNCFEPGASGQDAIRIALLNNMPDAVFEQTETQFLDLLKASSGDIPVSLQFFSLPHLSRCGRVQRRLEQFYGRLDSLFHGSFDAVIVTGTEPRHADLRQEPYWPPLVEVLEWAQENTASTVLSCLAAHAGVLQNDGIRREPLSTKQCGVFSFEKTSAHPLTRGLGDWINFPHSRWNEVRAPDLKSRGYTVLLESAHHGVDLFVKRQRNSLFVYFQGHPEYLKETLLEEYRRDIRRFLRKVTDTYPSLPAGYLDAAAEETLNRFRSRAMAQPDEQVLAEFPEALAIQQLRNTWQRAATAIYRNWLQYVASMKPEMSRTLSSTIGQSLRRESGTYPVIT